MVGKETTTDNSLDFHMQNLQLCDVNYVQHSSAAELTPLPATWAKLSKYFITSLNFSDRPSGSKW